ncbi:hypothetical protein LOTGIDRAFT_190920 [Lottia gigantea]|uniref:Aminotransferase class I/classII large domain-containing protein n=1 Tax=Lottia gigantea TaxID=225164 RepID=V4AAM9_LOTGI|nr:hypothetical protein LOTGIDRAFT_190920 [Lottia gigantea]ESO92150.1 hypothetical protein LOTGIDRAFT_190920 [Lottia gigantea]
MDTTGLPITQCIEERLSSKAEEFLNGPPDILQDEAYIVNVDLYDKSNNPDGFIKLGISESRLCEDLMIAKMKELQKTEEDASLVYYSDTRGSPKFRTAMKRFLERFFKPNHAIDIEQLHSMAPTSMLEMLAFCLADPGEYIMTPSPFYYNFYADVMSRAGVDIVTVPVAGMDKGSSVSISMEQMEASYQAATQQGKRIRAIIIFNPHNPVGYILTKHQILNILHFSNKYKLHVIFDEIYALSVFNQAEFTSVLSLDVPDPQRLHFIYGLSKDFGLSGYRMGILYSRNKRVLKFCRFMGNRALSAGPIDFRSSHLLDDLDWIENVYVPTHQSRLQEVFNKSKSRVEKLGLYVFPAQSCFFLWIYFGKFMRQKSVEEERRIGLLMIKNKIFLCSGEANFSPAPGWFRLTVTVDQDELEIGLQRLENVVTELELENINIGIHKLPE